MGDFVPETWGGLLVLCAALVGGYLNHRSATGGHTIAILERVRRVVGAEMDTRGEMLEKRLTALEDHCLRCPRFRDEVNPADKPNRPSS